MDRLYYSPKKMDRLYYTSNIIDSYPFISKLTNRKYQNLSPSLILCILGLDFMFVIIEKIC